MILSFLDIWSIYFWRFSAGSEENNWILVSQSDFGKLQGAAHALNSVEELMLVPKSVP